MLVLNWNIIWTFIDLIILYLLLRKFLYKPVQNIMASRKQQIEESVSKARADQQAAEVLLAELQTGREEKERMAETEIKQQMQRQLEHAETESGRLIAAANEQAAKIIADGKVQAEKEREHMLKSTRDEIAGVVVEAAKKVSGGRNREEGNSEFFQNLIKKAGEQYHG